MFKHSILALGLTLTSTFALAQATIQYEVTITNITPGQSFTPQLVITHPGDIKLFQVGTAASEALEIMAEGGDTAPLSDEVANVATEVQTIAGLLTPGQSVTTVISGARKNGFISVVAMLIPTNDTFFALNGLPLPDKQSGTITSSVPAYDAGTELNDQSCQNIPGPRCPGGIGYTAETGEGFVHISNGFHELGSEDAAGFEVLRPQRYDWRNPVAQITVKRFRH